MIYSYLSYCTIVWGSANNTILHKLITLQKRAIRFVTNSPYGTHTGPLFISLRFLKLIDIYQSQVIIYMYKAQYNISSIHCSRYFKPANSASRYLIRNASSFQKISSHIMIKQHSFSIVGPNLWN